MICITTADLIKASNHKALEQETRLVKPYDIIVLGAGIAGLATAEILGNAGLHVAVIEARERVGGRIYSLPGLTPEHTIELGAEFVHGKPKLLDDYLQSHHLPLYETDGRSYCMGAKGLEPCGEPGLDLFGKLDKLNLDDFPDESFETTLQRRFADSPEEEKRWARGFVQGFHAADPSRISTHSIMVDNRAEEETDGLRGFHIAGGYSRLVETLCTGLAPRVELLTSTTVVSVDWSKDLVAVQARRGLAEMLMFEAPRVVITLPLGVLQQRPPTPGAVRFEPELTEKRDALSKLAMGAAVRLTLQFDSMFWQDPAVMGKGVLPDLHFLFTRDPVFPTFWSARPLRIPVLVAWAGGAFAESKLGRRQPEREMEAVAALARIFSIPEALLRSKLVRSYFRDWQNDPFSRGAYSYVLAGGMGAQDDLARPLRNRLFFAGEATQSDGHHATVHGAFASGPRAAQEILGISD